MPVTSRARRGLGAHVLVGALSVALVALGATSASADSQPTNPSDPKTPTTVTADALPTVQINGVAWDQVVVGDTVYVVGRFTTARPAGSAPGTNEVPRANMLAYDINTGALKTGFVADLNGEALSVAASPDGSRVYIAGSFTSVNGQTRYRAAAFNTATGALDPTFRPVIDGATRAVVTSGSTVYYGGNFSRAGGAANLRVAALDGATGVSRPGFSASADLRVNALTMSPDQSKLVVGGAFLNLNSTQVRGLGAVDAATGASVTWKTSETVYGYGNQAAILSLESDGDSVYGTAYSYAGTGNFEGTFRASGTDGAIKWIEDCHGDTYSVHPTSGVTYTTGHPHNCSTIGGFPEVNPRRHVRAAAFTKAVTGTVKTNNQGGYANFAGQPAPNLVNWFPDLDAGTFTGQSQAGWSVEGNDSYVVMGGEFPAVNGVRQQGLTRFASKATAPNRVAPVADATFAATATSTRFPRRVTVRWGSSFDNDNSTLVYKVFRGTTQVGTVTGDSNFWTRPQLSFVDTSAPSGTQTYRVTATDPFGNTASTPTISVTVS